MTSTCDFPVHSIKYAWLSAGKNFKYRLYSSLFGTIFD